jgi:hypothetical protein
VSTKNRLGNRVNWKDVENPMYYDVYQYNICTDEYKYIATEYGRTGKAAIQVVANRHSISGGLYFRPSCPNKSTLVGDKGRDTLQA